MPDIIQLLPDSVANQIAAGEVIQRPASAVKELIENAIDAKGSFIKLIIKDAGRTLIQVIDDGIGMSETDARMCFERHATSKIKSADDLFRIKTMGFRGEAMASIAGVAQVEMKTKRAEDQLGTQIEIEGSEFKSQTQCACSKGTSISVKNLFFNVPARRNFLKSDSVELRHIIDEFQRIAIAHPEVSFSLHNNNSELFHLEKGTLRQRLVDIWGGNYNQRLVPVDENTTIVHVTGYVGKPEFARKTRGEQFFFVNNRFIKSPYLHHAIQNAYNQLLPPDVFPSYFIHLAVDPKLIDVNIHPTKTEIKFEDEKAVYTIIRSAVKQSLGKYNIAPTLDFEQEVSIELPPQKSREEILMNPPKITINKNYNPFEVEEKKQSAKLQKKENKTTSSKFEQPASFESTVANTTHFKKDILSEQINRHEEELTLPVHEERTNKASVFQLHNKYILAQIKTGMLVIDQQSAHERILFENYFDMLEHQKGTSQQQLFPQTFECSATDALVLNELQEELKGLGFDINEFGKNAFIIHGTPAGIDHKNIIGLVEKIIDDYKESKGSDSNIKNTKREIIAKGMAKNLSIKYGQSLSNEEMSHLVDSLFACKMPYSSPEGKPTLVTIGINELEKKLNK